MGESIGIGAVAAWADGKLVKAADVRERKWRIVSIGPVRAIVELEYGGWNLGPESITLRSRITQWAGEHAVLSHDYCRSAVFCRICYWPSRDARYCPGKIPSNDQGYVAWPATWGGQVVAPGATATEAVPGQNLGLAVLTNMERVEFVADHLNHLFRFRLHDGKASWYATAAWDQEDTEQREVAVVNQQGAHFHRSALRLPDSIATRDAFLSAVKDQSLRMRAPVIVRILSNSNTPGG